MRKHRRTALTLLELLVVIAVIGVLIALTAPAIQRARDAAARAACANNLRQIGLGLHHFEGVQRRFPPGVSVQRGKDPNPFMSWQARILPYLEQDALWQVTVKAYETKRGFWENPPHVGFSTLMPIYACPADSLATTLADINGFRAARTSYFGVEGTDQFLIDGMLFLDSGIRLAEVRDGTSNTLMVGERGMSAAEPRFGWWYAGVGLNLNGAADMVLGVREVCFGTFPPPGCAPGPYYFGPGRADNPCDVLHFWSLHAGGGANFLFADGAVRFVAYSANPIMPALATRAGNEVAVLLD
jgi:prepilin-type N-terminal cleavage/methylation domain-containing protein/prepilin-type processing-associated H-X9-DG protein